MLQATYDKNVDGGRTTLLVEEIGGSGAVSIGGKRWGEAPGPASLDLDNLYGGMRKFLMASGSCWRARLDVGSKLMSWSMNWPRKVKPAAIVGLSGLSMPALS